MNRDVITSSRYSPGNLPGEILEKLFVAREPLLADVLRRIEGALTKRSQYFQLLVGPRGAGKTHLLALLRHRLATDSRFEAHRAKLCLAPLAEEEWGVASYLDLLVRILRAIATYENDAGLHASIEEIHKHFARSPETSAARAEDLLVKHVGDRTLVVLCENLDEILDGLGDEGQKRWRASMQQRRFWNVVATTSGLSDALRDHGSPFFNFFNVRHLDRLDLAAATALMRRKAEVDGKHDLAALIDTPLGRARMRAIHHLAGGNSRVYVILSDFLTKDSLDALWPAFVRTVDDLTPYYQDRIRQLAPAQRKIVECLCQAVHAIRVKDIAARCLMSPQTAAKQLSELARLGYVEGRSHGRETFYELMEPLLRICIDVKDNRTRHLRTFVELMRHWFSVGDMQERLRLLDGELGIRRPMDRLHLEVALEEAKREGSSPFLVHLAEEGDRCERRGDHAAAAETFARLVRERGWPTDYWGLASAQRGLGARKEAEKTLRRSVKKHPEETMAHVYLARFLSEEERTEDALAALDGAKGTTLAEPLLDEARSEVLRSAGRFKEASRFDERIVAKGRKGSVDVRARALVRLGRAEEALVLLDREIARDTRNDGFLSRRGWILLGLRRYGDVIANEDAISGLGKEDEFSEYRRAQAFASMGKADEALAIIDRRIARDPSVANEHRWRSGILATVGRSSEALWSAREAYRLDPASAENVVTLAMGLTVTGDAAAALDVLTPCIQTNPSNEYLRRMRGHVLFALGRIDDAVGAFIEGIERGLESVDMAEIAQQVLAHGAPASVLRLHEALTAHGASVDGWEPVLARALFDLGRHQEAWRIVEPHVQGGGEWASLALMIEAVRTPDTVPPKLRDHVEGLASIEERTALLGDLLLGIARAHGPAALARWVPSLRRALGEAHGNAIAGGMLTLTLYLGRSPALVTPHWDEHLPAIVAGLDGLPAGEVVAQMLSAMVRYLRSKDPVVLLELPREVRELLTSALPKDIALN